MRKLGWFTAWFFAVALVVTSMLGLLNAIKVLTLNIHYLIPGVVFCATCGILGVALMKSR